MSIYLYSIRAKMVTVRIGGGTVHANTLEMLHTNWQGMKGDSDCPRLHAMKQGAALKYWEGRGLPNLVALKSGEDQYKLYRWTGSDCFWIDTDLMPGTYMGDVNGGVLDPHICADHPRRLYCSKIVCENCHATLEPRPGEIDAIRAKDISDREEDRRKQARRDDIWAEAREQEKFVGGLAIKANDLRNSVRHWEGRVADLARELEQAQGSLDKVEEMRRGASVAFERARETLATMEKIAKAEEARLEAEEAVPTTDC
jgi:hypothetical protein